MKKVLTLCMVTKDNHILLGMKKRGFGVGRWNGFGGKVASGEGIEAAAKRELEEEVGIQADVITLTGQLNFSFDVDSGPLVVYVYHVTQWHGAPVESEEMRPQWFQNDNLPFEQMWSDDIYWLPLLLEKKSFVGHFHFDKPATSTYAAEITFHSIEVVSSRTLFESLSE